SHARQLFQFIFDRHHTMSATNVGYSESLVCHRCKLLIGLTLLFVLGGKNLQHFGQYPFALGGVFPLDSVGHTMMQMVIKNYLAVFGYPGLRPLSSFYNTNTLAFFFRAFHNTIDMPRHTFEAIVYVFA